MHVKTYDNSIYSKSIKNSKIIKLFKKRDSELLENYRPIAICCIFSKITEKLLKLIFRIMILSIDYNFDIVKNTP